MVPQRQILHSYVKWRHVRDDTAGFWIIPRTPPARDINFPTARSRDYEREGGGERERGREKGKKGSGSLENMAFSSGENLLKYP